jgi:HAE1 family hydrophobic/amphiphilic exporter-1
MLKYYSLRLQVLGDCTTDGFELKIEDKGNDDWQTVSKVSNEFLGELMKRPEIQYAITNFNPNFLNIKWMLM